MTQAQAELMKTGDASAAPARNKFQELMAAGNVRTAAELRERVAALQQAAFVLTPSYIAQFAPGYEGTPQVVVIDPSVDAESGAGGDVYFQRSIHKSRKNAQDQWEPTEVSLNKASLLKILEAVGVNVEDPVWIQDGTKEPYLWMVEVGGTVLDFTGARRKLPSGIGSLDARDGSADIGEWTREEWAKRVAIADKQREKTAEKDRWKVKPEPINGWTLERVLGVRTKGRQLAQAKATNSLARNLGVRQKYSVEDLKKKPFIAVRTVFVPDMTNPDIAKLVTAHHLGALATLYPQQSSAPALPATSHAFGEAGQTLHGEVVEQTAAAEPEPEERMQTAAPPEGVEEVAEPPKQETAPVHAEPTYLILKVLRSGKPGTPDAKYFVETREGVTLYTADEQLLPALQAAAKDNTPRVIHTERVMVADKPYREIVEMTAPAGLKY